MKKDIKVSVLCISYNHVDTIRKAIESIISQRTSFEYEIIVHDDSSTDGTEDILRDYESRNIPNLKIVYERQNQYSRGQLNNIIFKLVRKSQGCYLALCEGDDYWIDYNKLQIQFDYMEKHKECVMTAHNGIWVGNRQHDIVPANGFEEEKDLSVEEIIRHKRGCFPTASIMVRKEHYYLEPPFDGLSIGDWPLQLQCIDRGDIHYFDRIMSVYNYEMNNSWSSRMRTSSKMKIEHSLEMIDFLQRLNAYWKYRYDRDILNAMEMYAVEALRSIDKNLNPMKELERVYNETDKKYVSAFSYVLKKSEERAEEKQRIREFVECNNKIYIMGCGEIAKELYELLLSMKIDIEGFVVSNNQKVALEYEGKKVNKLSQIKGETDKVGILVGIHPNIKTEIIMSLEENRIRNYYWPSI